MMISLPLPLIFADNVTLRYLIFHGIEFFSDFKKIFHGRQKMGQKQSFDWGSDDEDESEDKGATPDASGFSAP